MAVPPKLSAHCLCYVAVLRAFLGYVTFVIISFFPVVLLLFSASLRIKCVAWVGAFLQFFNSPGAIFATIYLSLAWSVPLEVTCLLLVVSLSSEVVAWIGALYHSFVLLSLFLSAVYLSLA